MRKGHVMGMGGGTWDIEEVDKGLWLGCHGHWSVEQGELGRSAELQQVGFVSCGKG